MFGEVMPNLILE